MTLSRLLRALACSLLLTGALAAPTARADDEPKSPDAERLHDRIQELRRELEKLGKDGGERAAQIKKEMAALGEELARLHGARPPLEEASRRVHEAWEEADRLEKEGRVEEARAARLKVEALAKELHAAWEKHPPSREDIERHAAELKEKAAALRAKGSVEDAEHLERKASRLREAIELRERSADLERQAHELVRSGHEAEAKRLMEESGRTWKQALEILGHRPPKPRIPDEPETGWLFRLSRGSPEQVADRVEHLRAAARHLREAGMPDRAEETARQAEAIEHAARAREEGPRAEVEALREEVGRLRREIEDLTRALKDAKAHPYTREPR